ncbi:MAG: hypothetical protein U9R22_02850 [Pseudomonadota bacterium]|nr:hypothetical protein [Pseudomonadota bacterium]
MKNAQPPVKAELSALDSAKFTGIDTPRQWRVIRALLTGPQSRETIDRVAGASNGPEVIRQLRVNGLIIPCELVPHTDRDGRPGKHGVYHLSESDRRRIYQWQAAMTARGLL